MKQGCVPLCFNGGYVRIERKFYLTDCLAVPYSCSLLECLHVVVKEMG